MNDKPELRAAALARRAARSPAQRIEAGRAIAKHGLTACLGIRTVAAFESFGSEPPTAPLLARLRADRVRILLPVVDGPLLDWSADDDRLGSAALRGAELIFVPALAVDRSGNRLGRGRGYYDRALVGVTSPVIAVGYDDELVDAVPAEAHDIAVCGFLSPGGLVTLR